MNCMETTFKPKGNFPVWTITDNGISIGEKTIEFSSITRMTHTEFSTFMQSNGSIQIFLKEGGFETLPYPKKQQAEGEEAARYIQSQMGKTQGVRKTKNAVQESVTLTQYEDSFPAENPATVVTASQKAEIKKNRTGKLILAISILLIIIGCAAGAGWLAPIAMILFIVGVIITCGSRSADQIHQSNALAARTAELMVAQVKAGQKFDIDDTPMARAARQKEETKAIVKGAVVGSIIAGDVGAVAGATIAKNKIDNAKKK